jgi:2-polyprenyl-3-methyl-5-hydroxy-6-metoxy-1,4-benzoquinol methylase
MSVSPQPRSSGSRRANRRAEGSRDPAQPWKPATDPEITFSFGENWRDFLRRTLDEEQLRFARERTKELLRVEDLQGLTFLDIGCGSGLFSFVAHSLGAKRVISIDVDPLSVDCCRYMKNEAGNPDNWDILQGSILDRSFLATLSTADIVYSWGVLHHTGDMWQAIRNAAALVRPGGRFAIAIYNRLEFNTLKSWRGSHKWLRIKRAYNRASKPMKRLMELSLAAKDIGAMVCRLRNPLAEIRAYKRHRGMSWWHDKVDWLGGYPYEFASSGEIFTFCHDELGMQLERLRSTSSIGCHEFLFITADGDSGGASTVVRLGPELGKGY